MKYLFLSLLLFIISCDYLNAQLLPPNRAEQDACHALEICGNKFSTLYSYQGNGLVFDLSNSPCATPGGFPAGAGEDNAVWLKLKIITSGTIVFTVKPVTSTDDYDWAVLNITNRLCSDLSSSEVVRCNYNNNYDSATSFGITGLDNISTSTGTGAGVSGGHFLRKIDAVAGQVYLVMVNNFGTGGNNLGSGFTIDFSGSTAVFNNNTPPKFQSISNICFSGNKVTLGISKDILCSSIAPNGSDFQLSATSANVISASGLNCSNLNQGYANEIDITFNQNLLPGTYYLKAKKGTDNNTLIDLCNNALLLPDSIKFIVFPDNRITLAVDTEGCGSVVFNGHVYTQSIFLRDTVLSSTGCDSIYYDANIKVYGSPVVINETVGHCDSVVFRGITYKDAIDIADTFKNHLGCDSLLHVYHIMPEHLMLSLAADPPEPVIGDYVTITTSSNIDNYNVQYWAPQNLFSNQFALSQSYIIPHSDTIVVVGTSPQGCIDTAKLFLKADTLVPIVIMPNAFSPNGDGLNDVFEPYFVNKSGYLVKNFKVFDRWGKLIYQAANKKKASWSGNYYNDDKPAATGTYFFFIDVQFVDGTKKYFKGDVTLLR